MKLLSSISIACALVGTVAYATSTDPVGFNTHVISGTTPSGLPTALTVIYPSLVQNDEFVGTTSVDPTGGTVFTFSGGVPATFDTSYVLEIPSTGWWSTVTASTATTITVNDTIPNTGGNIEVSVRKHNTVQSFLGENNPGIAPFDGVNADEVQLLTPAQGLIQIVYVPSAFTGDPDDNWYNLITNGLENDRVIEPGTAILIKTASATDLVFQSTGKVKESPTQVDIYPGLTLIGHYDAVGATLGALNFATQMRQFDNVIGDFDELQVLTPAQGLVQYIALDPSLGGPAMANLITTANADNENFPEGTGSIYKRDFGQPATVITLPSSTVSP